MIEISDRFNGRMMAMATETGVLQTDLIIIAAKVQATINGASNLSASGQAALSEVLSLITDRRTEQGF
jgi:hypothetical protein